MRKKTEVYGYWWLKSSRVFVCLLMTLACGLLPSAAVLAEYSASEGMIDVHFTDYEDLYFSILEITSGPENDTQFDSLPESTQAMFIAAIFEMEIMNGGLCQFFVNCGSSYATRVTQSLQMIGLEPMGILYDSFLSDNQIDPADLSSFQIDTIDDFSTQYKRYPFGNFDNAYVKLWRKLDYKNVMLQYANAHSEAFLQP